MVPLVDFGLVVRVASRAAVVCYGVGVVAW